MIANQTEFSILEQRSFIKVLPSVKCKPCDIYRRMCDVYGKARFTKKINYLHMS